MQQKLKLIGLVVLGILIGILIEPIISNDNIYKQVKKFDYVLNTAYKNYVDEVDTEKLVEAAIRGMLNELDVHSIYIDAEEMKRVNEDFQGSFEGIGVEFDIINDTITIVSPIPGGPSEQLGIMSGDKIINIDGESAIGLSRTDVPKKLRGPKGTKVEVDIYRSGSPNLLHFVIIRDKIPLNTIDAAYIIEGTDIGVVVVNRFAATTHSELLDALDNLTKQGMKKLILDLRGNPGGYLNQAFEMADEFIARGDTIVYTKGRIKQFDETFIAKGGNKYEKIPLIVLINSGSASASEIVSGAIQDLDRGLIVGESSYGKGLVQRQFEIGDGSAFRLTISRYYTPSGRSIQRPYKDKDKYRNLVGRMELEEGSYLENALEKIKKQLNEINEKEKDPSKKIDFNSLPIYKTRKGRIVFGGGGINPDYIIKSDTITNLSVQIRRKNLFAEFVDNYMKINGQKLRQKYHDNFADFYRNFKVDDEMLKDLKKLAESKDIKWDEEQFAIDKEYLQVAIKANIARVIWDRSRMIQIFTDIDKQVQKAIELFPYAEKFVRK